MHPEGVGKRTRPHRALCALLLPLLPWVAVIAPAQAAVRPPKLPALRVSGNKVVDDRGAPVRLRGVNCASMEWTSDGEGHILSTIRAAITDWHANIVRLPLSQDRWFGRAPEQHDGGKAYRALVQTIVNDCASNGCYILLDLHWSDAAQWGKLIGQHKMPDVNSVDFWSSCARAYRNKPAVLFDLYNEPHDVSWDVWHDGGDVTERDRRTGAETAYKAVGMQTMLDAVRATGARNVVVAGGLDWAYDLSGILAGRQLADPEGRGVIYANHNYPFKGDTIDQWLAKMETATQKLPVIVSEFGAAPSRGASAETSRQWVERVLQAMRDHDWSWIAWDLHPRAGPALVSDWDYTPTPYYGALVKEALSGAEAPGHAGP